MSTKRLGAAVILCSGAMLVACGGSTAPLGGGDNLTPGGDVAGGDADGAGAGALGSDCASDSECDSGICYQAGSIFWQVCSLCEQDIECGALRVCLLVPEVGYARCVGTAALGDNCESDDQCASGFCHAVTGGAVCSECLESDDCFGGGTCTDDSAVRGYWICAGGLGDACSDAIECDSGYCYTAGALAEQVCSLCAVTLDCGVLQACSFDPAEGYAHCAGTAQLGDNCSADEQCASGFCHELVPGGVCSQCDSGADCLSGACLDAVTDPAYGFFVCAGELGAPCLSGSGCLSGLCFPQGGVWGPRCSLCETADQCDANQQCAFDRDLEYATCSGALALGDACSDDAECRSAICNVAGDDPVCSECRSAADCSDGGQCVDDLDGAGYWLCSGGLGDACSDGLDCASGYCFDGGAPYGGRCSTCEDATDCSGQQECIFRVLDGYATCVGVLDLGDACSDAADCRSGFCTQGRCAECTLNADCTDGGLCVDLAGGADYYECAGGLGDPCASGLDCVAGYCYTAGPDWQDVCSLCEAQAQCQPSEDCAFRGNLGYATCR